MASKYSHAFKQQAVEKVFMRTEGVTVSDVAHTLNVSRSALNKWLSLAKQQTLKTITEDPMTTEKKPHAWSAEERLNMLLNNASLSEEKSNELCRMNGLFPHHLEQWKIDFIAHQTAPARTDIKQLRPHNKALQKERNRKEKALAETAALLVLQKKVNHYYADDEESSL
jgi:transposase-like protein